MDRLRTLYTALADELGMEPSRIVPGTGNIHAQVVLVGEAPGAEEARQGRPFVGRAGKNLDALLAETGVARDALFITNAVKFRPTAPGRNGRDKNRTPTGAEVAACRQCLAGELAILSPRLVVTLGNTALRAVTGEAAATVGNMHGRLFDSSQGFGLFPLYHPASILYNPRLRDTYVEDMHTLARHIHNLFRET